MSGDFNKPALGDGYSNILQEVRDIVADMAKGFDPALSLGTANYPTNVLRWTSTNKRWEIYNGTTWVNNEPSGGYAINISGSAAKWGTARNIALTGDVTGNGNIDGSANLSFAATLANVNSNVGSFGSATQSMQMTVNGKGLITAISNATITPAWGSITSKPTTVAGYGISDLGSYAPSLTGAGASGTWGINITGNAATATTASALTAGIASSSDVAAGIDNAKMVTAAAIHGALLFSKGFESSAQAVTPNSTLNIAHGLGVQPKMFKVILRCSDPELNYSIGDEVSSDFIFVSGVSVIESSADATNIIINYTGASTAVLNKTTQVNSTITSAKWKFIARAWA